jgi:formate C-acetyltransferase
MGEKTGATPDGRLAGEEFSKNLSPTMGMDRNGVTALIKSVCTMSAMDLPGDFPLDVMMHPATVQGEEGLAALRALLYTYFAKGGLAIHFNIFDAEVLKEAQKNPEKYANLQIRVCGWNVRFVELAKAEQDAYIKRAENVAE